MKNKTILIVLALLMLTIPVAYAERPVLNIVLVSQDPQPATPGTLVDVVFQISNQGEIEARGLIVELVESFPVTVADGQTAKEVGFVPFLDDSEPLLVRYKLDLDDNAPDGDVPFRVRMSYEGLSSPIEKEFDLDVQSRDASLTVRKVDTTPDNPLPGQEGLIAITLENTASTSLRDIQVKLDLSSADLPFTPTDTATTQRVNLLRAGESKIVSYRFVTDATAEPGAFKIPLNITFSDNLNNDFSQKDTVGVQVGADPKMSAYVDSTTLTQSGQSGEVVIKVVNKGFTDVKFLEVISPDNGVKIVNSREEYVGNLDSDDFETVNYDIFFEAGAPENFELPVQIRYTDTNNVAYNEQFTLTVNTKPAVQNNSGGTVVIAVIVIVVLVIGIWLWKRRRKDDDE